MYHKLRKDANIQDASANRVDTCKWNKPKTKSTEKIRNLLQ